MGVFRTIPASGLLILLMVEVYFIAGCSYYNGPVTDHFDGSRFTNNEPDHSFSDMVKWWWEMETVEWPDWLEDPPQPPPVVGTQNGELRITYINHATVLVQMDGVNILTDPFWSNRAGPFPWLGAKRVRSPGVRIEDLPNIDVILISHDHYDHLDFATLKRLIKLHDPLIFAGLGLKKRLKDLEGVKVVELDWWQKHLLGAKKLEIVCVPAKHNSGRGLFDKNKTLWAGFILKSAHGNVLFMGDTGFGDFFQEVRNQYGAIRLAVLPIGSYEKRWFMKNQHMNPDDAVRAHITLDATQSVGIHFGTLKEHPEQSLTAHETDLAEALNKYGVPPDRFCVLNFGEGLWVSAP